MEALNQNQNTTMINLLGFKKSSLIVMIFVLHANFVYSQNADKEIAEIQAQRNASNNAIRQFDDALSNTFLTEDSFITTGAGTLIAGKDALLSYIENAKGLKMYWVRTPDEIRVNLNTMLAWESGTWEGFYENDSISVVGGNYAAMWTKASGIWLLKSQLFVTLTD
jgi:hypothetical protein